MKQKFLTFALFFLFYGIVAETVAQSLESNRKVTNLSPEVDGLIDATPEEWQLLVDSLEQEGLKLYKMDLLTSDHTGGRFRTIEVEQPPFVELQTKRLPGLQKTETMIMSEEVWIQRWVPVIENPEYPQEIRLHQVWQRTISTARYTYLVEQQYYIWSVITSHYLEWEKPPEVAMRSVTCPAPDPITEVIFVGTTNAEAESTYNGTFRPTYETDHMVTIDDISLTGSDPFTVFQGSVVSLKESMEGAGSGILVPEVSEISDVAYCHSECQQIFGQFGHVCNGYDPIGRFIALYGPIGLCFMPGGPLEVTGTGGSTDPFILSLQINMSMIMSDAASGWGHFRDLSACAYASGMGVGFYAGASGTVTCNWVNATGAGPCANSPIACGTILPLELTYYGFMPSTFDNECGDIETGWGVAQSLDAHYVAIERALDNGYFEEIGRVYANGDHSDLRHYTFLDSDVPKNVSVVYYQLRMVDLDGSIEYSDVIAKSRRDCSSESLFSAYPNPFTDYLVVSGLDAGDMYEVFDIMGRTVYESIYAGGEVSLDLQSGIYFLHKVRTLETIKVIKN